MKCEDLNPWDNEIVCDRELAHDGMHSAWGGVRWSDRCHFEGDDCSSHVQSRSNAATMTTMQSSEKAGR